MSSFNELKTRLNNLNNQRELLELEANTIVNELSQRGTNDEEPVGLKGSLIDREGFPKTGFDLWRIKELRGRHAIISNDHYKIMKEIEQLVHNLHQYHIQNNNNNNENKENEEKINNISNNKKMKINNEIFIPFAWIDSISDNSPAQLDGLQVNDRLINFGNANWTNSNSDNNLNGLIEVVKNNINQSIPIILLRKINNEWTKLDINITPRTWNGNGLLGFHLMPWRGEDMMIEQLNNINIEK